MGNGNTKKEVEYLKGLGARALEENFTLPTKEAQKLLQALRKAKTTTTQEWTSNVVSYLCRNNDANRRLLGAGIKHLVGYLRTESITVQTWAMCALGNLCIDCPENREAVRNSGAIEKMINFLNSGNADLLRWSCHALGLVCCDNAKNQDLFLGLGGLKPLLKCLSMSTIGDAPRSQQKKWAVFALANVISESKFSRQVAVGVGTLEILVNVLQEELNKVGSGNLVNSSSTPNVAASISSSQLHASNAVNTPTPNTTPGFDDEMLRWICNTLCILCEDSADARKELGRAGGIEILTVMMDPEHPGNFSEKVKINACLALNNGCTGDAANQKRALESQGLDKLIRALKIRGKFGEEFTFTVATTVITLCKNRDDIPPEVKSILSQDGYQKNYCKKKNY